MSGVDREFAGPEQSIGAMQSRLDAVEARLGAGLARRPTGDVELAFRAAPKPGTLFMQGQTLNRVDYPALWKWAQDSGSVVAGGYGAGNGSTTFTLPDARDRALVVAGGLYALGQKFGVDAVALTTAQLAVHGHTTDATSHLHAEAGGHGDHNYTTVNVRTAVPGETIVLWGSVDQNNGNVSHHTHATTGSHTHPVTSTGSGATHENRPPSLGINLAVWL